MHFKFAASIFIGLLDSNIELELTFSAWNVASLLYKLHLLFYLNNFYYQLECLQAYVYR